MSAEAALKIVETEEVEAGALSVVEQAKAVKVVDPESYTRAGAFWKDIRAMRSKVAETFDPLIKQAHELHRNTLAKKNAIDKPLENAERAVKQLMSDYDAEQERIRKEEQDRLAAIARKEEEDRLLAEALLAEESGDKEEAQAILDEPVYVPPVVVPKATPKLTGGPVYREIWSAEVFDIKALCRAVADGRASTECVTGNMPVLNKMATALKNTMNVPGVKAYSRRV